MGRNPAIIQAIHITYARIMNPKRKAPTPIIDNLEFIGNPFKQQVFDSTIYLEESISGADLDLEYALKFLFNYNGSTATFNSYRREIERLLQWSWHINEASVLTLKREHIEEFIKFCFNPPKAWIGIKNVARFKSKDGARIVNADWRPYVVTVSKTDSKKGIIPDPKSFCPSQSSVKATFTAVSSFYDHLIQENLVDSNPVALIKQKSKFIRKEQTKPIVRRISNIQWDYVLEVVEQMADEDPEQHERSLFVMNCLFAMYLRISELVADERSSPIMGDFKKDIDGNWWLHVTGKGNKSRTVTVCNDMLSALKRYRKYQGLSTYPAAGEQTPLVPKLKGTGPVTSTRQIRRLVQDCFDAAYEQMKYDGLEEDAAELRSATVHWLRHTGISEDVKFRPREHVRDDAGHASMATTDRYIDSDLRERHASGREKRVKDI
ncbi:MAG: site-specific integrase [Pseudomonadales bacterium]|nr:site-specific integrase [Pseudomonadales bacterium]